MIKFKLKTICLLLTLLLLSFNITKTKADTIVSEYSVEEIRNATETVRKLKEEGYDPNEPFASEEEIRKAIEIVKKTKIDEKEDENLPSWKKSAIWGFLIMWYVLTKNEAKIAPALFASTMRK